MLVSNMNSLIYGFQGFYKRFKNLIYEANKINKDNFTLFYKIKSQDNEEIVVKMKLD